MISLEEENKDLRKALALAQKMRDEARAASANDCKRRRETQADNLRLLRKRQESDARWLDTKKGLEEADNAYRALYGAVLATDKERHLLICLLCDGEGMGGASVQHADDCPTHGEHEPGTTVDHLAKRIEDLRHPNKFREDWDSDRWAQWQREESARLPGHGRHIARFHGLMVEEEDVSLEGVIYSSRNGTRMFVAGNWVGPCAIDLNLEDGSLTMGPDKHLVTFTKIEEENR